MGAEVKSMDIKKSQQAAAADQTKALKKIKEFFADVKNEVKKITWTPKDELIFYTKIVVASTFIFGMVIYALDLTIQSVLNGLSFLLHLIGT